MQSTADWDSVTIIRKSKPAAKDLKSASAINKALASGTAEITKKSKLPSLIMRCDHLWF